MTESWVTCWECDAAVLTEVRWSGLDFEFTCPDCGTHEADSL